MINLTSILYLTIICLLLSYIAYLKATKKRKRVKVEKGDYQVVVVVNKELGMSKGKTLSQFGHGIDSLHERLRECPELEEAWRNSGSAKITLKGTQEDLNKVYSDSKEHALIAIRIFDAGKTQVKAGSNTVVVVGPATKKNLENITGFLSLY